MKAMIQCTNAIHDVCAVDSKALADMETMHLLFVATNNSHRAPMRIYAATDTFDYNPLLDLVTLWIARKAIRTVQGAVAS